MNHLVREEPGVWDNSNLAKSFLTCMRNLWIGLQKGMIQDTFYPDVNISFWVIHCARNCLLFSWTCWIDLNRRSCPIAASVWTPSSRGTTGHSLWQSSSHLCKFEREKSWIHFSSQEFYQGRHQRSSTGAAENKPDLHERRAFNSSSNQIGGATWVSSLW